MNNDHTENYDRIKIKGCMVKIGLKSIVILSKIEMVAKIKEREVSSENEYYKEYKGTLTT